MPLIAGRCADPSNKGNGNGDTTANGGGPGVGYVDGSTFSHTCRSRTRWLHNQPWPYVQASSVLKQIRSR